MTGIGQEPLTIRMPIKGKLLLRIDGSDTLHELGEIEYEASVDVSFKAPGMTYRGTPYGQR